MSARSSMKGQLPVKHDAHAENPGAAAKALGLEGETGTIAPGTSADLIWLDRDPRNTPPLDLPGVGIRATYLRGAQAHRAED